jgi:hypothetical protein
MSGYKDWIEIDSSLYYRINSIARYICIGDDGYFHKIAFNPDEGIIIW